MRSGGSDMAALPDRRKHYAEWWRQTQIREMWRLMFPHTPMTPRKYTRHQGDKEKARRMGQCLS
jgi:hypothetical protein